MLGLAVILKASVASFIYSSFIVPLVVPPEEMSPEPLPEPLPEPEELLVSVSFLLYVVPSYLNFPSVTVTSKVPVRFAAFHVLFSESHSSLTFNWSSAFLKSSGFS